MMGQFVSKGFASKERQLGRRRGLGFSKDEGLINQTKNVQEEVTELVENAEPVDPVDPGPPESEIRKAEEYLSTVKSLLGGLESAFGQLQSILQGNYTQDVKNKAESLAGQISNLESDLETERNRAQAFLRNARTGPPPGPRPAPPVRVDNPF